MKIQYKAIYLCERCWSKFGIDVDPVDTGMGNKKIFIQQIIFHDCPYGGLGKAVFMYLNGEAETDKLDSHEAMGGNT